MAPAVGCNVQASGDARHHLIVDHEVTNEGFDSGRLAEMAKNAKEAIGTDDLTVVADRSYFDGEQMRACDDADITTFVPKPLRGGGKAKGRFGARRILSAFQTKMSLGAPLASS